MWASTICILAAGITGVLSTTLLAQELSGVAARQAARAYRDDHEAAILREFTALLSLPNVASDRPNIRRNADLLMAMLRRRGAETRLLEVEGGPPAVYGEIRVPKIGRASCRERVCLAV